MPPKTLCIWCFMTARYTAAEDKVSMDTKNIFPATRCPWEPLRNDNAAATDSNATRPAQICRTNIGNRILPHSFCLRLRRPAVGQRHVYFFGDCGRNPGSLVGGTMFFSRM